MRKAVFIAVAVLLVLQFSIMSVFATSYDVSPDTEMVDSIPVYYTDNYYPGMFADGRSTFAVSSYGSYSAYNWNPVLFYQYGSTSSPQSNFISFSTKEPTVRVSNKQVSAEYVASVSASLLSADVLLNLDNTYFDFQSSDFTFNQESAQADTFLLNGTLRFSLTSFWEFFVSSTTTRYAAVDPVAVQLLVDGKPYGPVIDVSSYASPYTAAFSNTAPVSAVVTFDNVKIYGVTSTPELIGFRVYVDSNYDGGSYNLSLPAQNSGVLVTNRNIVSWTTQPTIDFVRESTSSDADLSNLGQLFQNGLFNGNGVPFLDIVNSFLEDGLFDSNGNSLFVIPSGFVHLDRYGNIGTYTERTPISTMIRQGFLGLRSLMVDSSGNSYLYQIAYRLQNASGRKLLYSDGSIITSNEPFSIAYSLNQGLMGLRALMVDSSGSSYLSQISYRLQNAAGRKYLYSDGSIVTSNEPFSIAYSLNQGLMGLRSLMVDSSGASFLNQIAYRLQLAEGRPYLSSNGTVNTTDTLYTLTYVLNQGLLGLSQNIKDVRNYFANGSFTWKDYNLETHELGATQTITGQNQFMNTAFQSIEENLGRLAYVFASDDEIDLRDQADAGVASFKESFGGGAKGKDIVQMKNTFDDVESMFDTGFSIDDLFDSLNSDSSWLSWFSAETAYSLDSTTTLLTVGDEDPFNHQAYHDHLAAVEAIRNRGGAD